MVHNETIKKGNASLRRIARDEIDVGEAILSRKNPFDFKGRVNYRLYHR